MGEHEHPESAVFVRMGNQQTQCELVDVFVVDCVGGSTSMLRQRDRRTDLMIKSNETLLAADDCGENCLTCGRCLTDTADTPHKEETE